MKTLGFIVLFLTNLALASSPAPEACGAASPNCAKNEKPHGGHGDLNAKMNSLFPQPEADLKQSARPAKAELTSPRFLADVSAGAINLEWNAIENTTNYHLQVATDPNFKWLVVNEHFVKTNSFNFDKAEAGKRYFWRVAAVNSQNHSQFTKSNFVNSAFNVK